MNHINMHMNIKTTIILMIALLAGSNAKAQTEEPEAFKAADSTKVFNTEHPLIYEDA